MVVPRPMHKARGPQDEREAPLKGSLTAAASHGGDGKGEPPLPGPALFGPELTTAGAEEQQLPL